MSNCSWRPLLDAIRAHRKTCPNVVKCPRFSGGADGGCDCLTTVLWQGAWEKIWLATPSGRSSRSSLSAGIDNERVSPRAHESTIWSRCAPNQNHGFHRMADRAAVCYRKGLTFHLRPSDDRACTARSKHRIVGIIANTRCPLLRRTLQSRRVPALESSPLSRFDSHT